jgi:hypothetical protein
MKIDLQSAIADLLTARVAAVDFATIDEAVTASVLGLGETFEPGDLKWTTQHLAAAKASLANGQAVDDAEAWSKIEQRFGQVG